MGCSSSNTSAETLTKATPSTTAASMATNGEESATQKYPASEAFVINLKRNATTMISLAGNEGAEAETATVRIEEIIHHDDSGEQNHSELSGDNEKDKDGNDDDDGSAVAKPPPKRIQRMIEEAAAAAEERAQRTLDDLEEKQRRAEERRRELMQQKIETIQKTTQMLMGPPDGESGQPDGESSGTYQPPEGALKVSVGETEQLKRSTAAYADEIKSQALDDDSKRQLLTTSATVAGAN